MKMMGKYHWFKIFRHFNEITNLLTLIAFIAWWWYSWAIYVTIGGVAWYGMVILAVMIPGVLAEKHILPRWMERLAFEAYRFQIKKMATKKNISPLVAYPFAIFCDLTLPNIFREKGLDAVLKECQEWGSKFKKRTEQAIAVHQEQLEQLEQLRNPTPAND
jgi:hypothetical protein